MELSNKKITDETNLDELQKQTNKQNHYAGQKKPDTKEHMLLWAHSHEVQN